MKILRTLLDKARPSFEEQGKLHRLKPVYDALDNILFSANIKTTNPPFGRDPIDVKRYMTFVIIGLVPAFLASVYFFGWRILLMLLVSYAVGAVVEVLFGIIRKEEINEGFLVTGFIFPLVLPPGLPLWAVAIGVAFGVLVGKEIFGGTGRNLFNAALVGRTFLALGYPSVMAASYLKPASGGWGHLIPQFTALTPDAVSGATPLTLMKNGQATSLLDLFLGHVGGSAGETSALAILIGGIFLLITGVVSWRTIVSILLSFAGLGALLHLLTPDAVNPVLFNLLAGGILFGTFFMATDPVTSPLTRAGKWAYGIIIGSVTLLIRSYSGYMEGVMFAILLGNICAPLIDEVVIRAHTRRLVNER